MPTSVAVSNLNSSAAAFGTRILAFDGKALKGSFDAFNDAKVKFCECLHGI